jgi:hypothetical protein
VRVPATLSGMGFALRAPTTDLEPRRSYQFIPGWFRLTRFVIILTTRTEGNG